MPGELYIYDGFVTDGSGTIRGSLNVTNGITGSLFGTASRAVTASYALTAGLSIDTVPTASVGPYNLLLLDPGTGVLYKQTSLQYNPTTDTIKATTATASFGAVTELAPMESTIYTMLITEATGSGDFVKAPLIQYDPQANTITLTASFATTASFVRNAASSSFATTASYILNAISASQSATASYVLNAVSASFASTASFVNTLNQNVLITGSLTIGATSLGTIENTLTLGPPIGGTSVEGGQIGFQAAPSSTSASFIDQYEDGTGPMIRILKGTNAGSQLEVAKWNIHTRQMILPGYTATNSYTGTVAGLLAFDSSGNILTTTASTGGGGGGSGTVNSGVAGYLAFYPSTGTTVDDTSGLFWDAATSRLGIGTATPNSGALHVSGGVFATSFTGSLLGTATTASFASTASFVNTLNQNVVITGSLGIAQTTPTSRLHLNFNQNSVTQSDANGILLANSTAATVSNNSISPPIIFQGNTWLSTSTTSSPIKWRIDALPEGGASSALCRFRIGYSSNNGSSYADYFTLNQAGDLTIGSILNTQSGYASSVLNCSGQLQAINVGGASVSLAYKTTSAGSNVSGRAVFGLGAATAGNKLYSIGEANGLVFSAGNGTDRISRAAIDITNLTNTAGAESADLILQTQSGGTAMTTKMLISGSGNVSILSGSLGIQQTAPTSRLHINANQNSVTQADANGILLANSTAATANTQSISPGIVFQGNGWKTDATAGSQDTRFRIDVLPVQGAANPTANLRIASSINAAAYTSALTYNSNGTLTVSQYVYGGSGVATAGQLQAINAAAYSGVAYRTTNVGSLSSNVVFAVGSANSSASVKITSYDPTNGFVFNAYNNNVGSNLIARAAIDITNLVNTSGSESADLAFQTKAGSPVNTPMTTKMTIGSTGNVTILSGSLITSAVTASFITSGSNLINLSNASGITISTTGSAAGFVNINTGLTGTVRISSPLIVTGSILSLDNITAYSDESVKSNVSAIPNALNKVLEMRGVTYTRTDLQDTERIHAGVIAQELERQFPEVVYELPNGKKTVAYGNITSILIEAIKEQQKQIDDLRKQIEKLT